MQCFFLSPEYNFPYKLYYNFISIEKKPHLYSFCLHEDFLTFLVSYLLYVQLSSPVNCTVLLKIIELCSLVLFCGQAFAC